MPTLVNRIRWLSFFAVFSVAWFNVVVGGLPAAVKTTKQGLIILAGTSAAGQAPAPRQRVLVLYSDERLLPNNIIMDEAIRATFAAGTKKRVEFYSEFLDLARFPGDGIEAARQLKRAVCRAKLVLLTAHEDPDYVRTALHAGGTAYVVKACLASGLITAIHEALVEHSFVSPIICSEETHKTKR